MIRMQLLDASMLAAKSRPGGHGIPKPFREVATQRWYCTTAKVIKGSSFLAGAWKVQRQVMIEFR
jgi:hypothetical protein